MSKALELLKLSKKLSLNESGASQNQKRCLETISSKIQETNSHGKVSKYYEPKCRIQILMSLVRQAFVLYFTFLKLLLIIENE